jgi:opacity protein-like surface antigen
VYDPRNRDWHRVPDENNKFRCQRQRRWDSSVRLLLSGADLHRGRVSVRLKSSIRIHTDILLPVFATLVLLAQPSGNAVAEDLLGLYVGGAIGQSRVEATSPQFNENHSAFKVMVGLRPISLLGAELAYIDLGHPSGRLGQQPNGDVSMKGVAAFGVLHLPVPLIDIFLKAGVARLQSALHSSGKATVVCPPEAPLCPGPLLPNYDLDRTNTGFAAGAGAQYKIGSWAVRAEYERFNAAGGNPSLLSAGITWSFF